MTQDRRAELLEKIDAAFAGGLRSNETMVAHAVLDIALKAAADVARNACLVPPDGGAPTETESEMCDRAAAAILALTSEGMKP